MRACTDVGNLYVCSCVCECVCVCACACVCVRLCVCVSVCANDFQFVTCKNVYNILNILEVKKNSILPTVPVVRTNNSIKKMY